MPADTTTSRTATRLMPMNESRLSEGNDPFDADSSDGDGFPSDHSSIPAPLRDEPVSLFEHNIQQINVMNVAAGSMVKGLIMELDRAGRDTYIRLRDPEVGGHRVSYDFVSGQRDLVGRIGRALGFALVTDDRLEVRHG